MFNIDKNIKNIKCPFCLCNILPSTLGFYNCEYQIIYEKLEEGKCISKEIKHTITKDKHITYFKRHKEFYYYELKIFTISILKIKK